MNKLVVALLTCVFAAAGTSVQAADTATAKDTTKTVKAQGGPCKPGQGDPSAAVKNKPQGGSVKCEPEASAKAEGRTGDPASPEKKK